MTILPQIALYYSLKFKTKRHKMNNCNVKMQIIDKRLHAFGIPDYATAGAAGIDLRAMLDENYRDHIDDDLILNIDYALKLNPGETALIPTGIAIDMPENMAAVILPRSGLGHKNGIVLGNLVGLIDEDFKTQMFISCWNRNQSGDPFIINLGDRIAQLVFVPVIKPSIEIVDAINENGRGGFNSTGVK